MADTASSGNEFFILTTCFNSLSLKYMLILDRSWTPLMYPLPHWAPSMCQVLFWALEMWHRKKQSPALLQLTFWSQTQATQTKNVDHCTRSRSGVCGEEKSKRGPTSGSHPGLLCQLADILTISRAFSACHNKGGQVHTRCLAGWCRHTRHPAMYKTHEAMRGWKLTSSVKLWNIPADIYVGEKSAYNYMNLEPNLVL